MRMSDDVVYKVTKTAHDDTSHDFLINAFKSWQIGLEASKSDDFIDQMKGFGLELHPGAARYWKKRGLIN